MTPSFEHAPEAELKLAHLKGYEEGKRDERKKVIKEMNEKFGKKDETD